MAERDDARALVAHRPEEERAVSAAARRVYMACAPPFSAERWQREYAQRMAHHAAVTARDAAVVEEASARDAVQATRRATSLMELVEESAPQAVSDAERAFADARARQYIAERKTQRAWELLMSVRVVRDGQA